MRDLIGFSLLVSFVHCLVAAELSSKPVQRSYLAEFVASAHGGHIAKEGRTRLQKRGFWENWFGDEEAATPVTRELCEKLKKMISLTEKIRASEATAEMNKALRNLHRPQRSKAEFKILTEVYEKIANDAIKLGDELEYHASERDNWVATAAVLSKRRQQYLEDLKEIYEEHGNGAQYARAIGRLSVEIAAEEAKIDGVVKFRMVDIESEVSDLVKQLPSSESDQLLQTQSSESVLSLEPQVAEGGLIDLTIDTNGKGDKLGIKMVKDAEVGFKLKDAEVGFKLKGWHVAGFTVFLGAAVLILAKAGVLKRIFLGDEKEVPKKEVVFRNILPEALLKERCREMNFAAAEAEGVAQQFLGSLTKWNQTVTALKPLYHRAYLQATLSQINNISTTNITNWGPSAPLPVALPTVGLSGEEKREAERKNEDANRQWEAKEFFRPLHLQHQLVGEYHDAVHESALNLMTQAIDLPYPAESEQFTIAYSTLYLRMAISPECKPHINEGGHITHWLEDSRNKQADRQLLLNGFARQHFAARSRMDPTLPAPVPQIV